MTTLRSFTFTVTLPVRNRLRQEGVGQYLLRIGPMSVLNIVILSALFATIGGGTFDVVLLANQYGYFIPLVVLSACVGSWEPELLGGIGEDYVLHPRLVLPTRAMSALPEVLAVCAIFSILIFSFRGATAEKDIITLLIMVIAFMLFGSGFGYMIGFRSEKSVNNFVTVIVWALGFGPGPFLGNDVSTWQLIFPGSLSVQGRFELEWLRSVILGSVGLFLIWFGQRPRRYRLFAK